MRILIYAHAFAPRIGGAETYVMLLARGLAARGEVRRVTVATPTPAEGFDDTELPFAVVRRPSLPALWRLVGTAEVVLLAGPCFVPLAMALLRRRPVVVEHHGYQAVCPNGLLLQEPSKAVCPGHFMQRRYARCVRCVRATDGTRRAVAKVMATFARRWMCLAADAHVAITAHVARRTALSRTEVVYYGVPDPGRAGDGQAPTLPTFAYVGRLVGEKGLPLLLEAARALKDEGWRFRVKIIGDGPERAALERRTMSSGLSEEVIFTGALRGQALEAAVRDASAVVMPSICEETAGLAAIEQMMRGRPVVAADIGGLGEVVDGAGLKFAPGDARGLTACLRRVLQDPALADELGRRARQRAVDVFGVERMVDGHLAVFRRLIASRAAAGARARG